MGGGVYGVMREEGGRERDTLIYDVVLRHGCTA